MATQNSKMALLALPVALLLLAWCAPQPSEAANILAVIPIAARSHHMAVGGVTRALADRGHNVTYVTGLEPGNKINPANNRIVHVGNPSTARMKKAMSNMWEDTMSAMDSLLFLMDLGVQLVNSTMSDPAFQAEINKPGQKYDLILIEAFFFQEAFVGLGHQFDVPVVAFHPFGATQMLNDVMGNPSNPAWVPAPFLGFSDRMSFSERLVNAVMHGVSSLLFEWHYLPRQQAVLSRYWPDAPSLHDLLRTRLGLAMLYSDFTMGYPAPLSPNVVEIGGLHIAEKNKALPKDLQEYMDAATEGVVYFSMGTNLRMEHLPAAKARAILGALGALNERVILKWDGPRPEGLAPNIRHVDWAPQADVLAHPNLRAFVTHGGLLSTQESVYHGVPLVGIPVFGDQHFNMLLAVRKGFCVRVDLKTLTNESMASALTEVLRNPRYEEAASRLSRLFRSKPLRPAETAVLAVEHVLQHGAAHLRPASVAMPLHQLLLLDVALLVSLAVAILALACRACCCRRAPWDWAKSAALLQQQQGEETKRRSKKND